MATRPSTYFQLQHFVRLLQSTHQNLNPLNPHSSSPPFHHQNPFQPTQSIQPTNSSGCLYQKIYQVTPISAHQRQGGHRRLVCPIHHRILCISSGVELLKCAHDFQTTSHDKHKYKKTIIKIKIKTQKQKTFFYSKYGIKPTEIIPRLFFCISFFNITSYNFIFFF